MTQFLFVTDLDNTLVGDDEALAVLNQELLKHRQAYGTKIVYATGRSRALYQELQKEKQLIEPDALVASVGTEIYYPDKKEEPDSSWKEILCQGWNRETVAAIAAQFSALVPQPASEQSIFKISFFIEKEAAFEILPELEKLFQEKGLRVQMIYSSERDLDLLPERANKGFAMQFLRHKWGISSTRTVVCGDSGNDIALFSVGDERGIIVGNAQPELLHWHNSNPAAHRYLAKAHFAAGILEGLKYFGFL